MTVNYYFNNIMDYSIRPQSYAYASGVIGQLIPSAVLTPLAFLQEKSGIKPQSCSTKDAWSLCAPCPCGRVFSAPKSQECGVIAPGRVRLQHFPTLPRGLCLSRQAADGTRLPPEGAQAAPGG